MAAHTYWRLYIGAMAYAYAQMGTVSFLNAAQVNQSTGGTATASSEYNGSWAAGNAFDGNPTSEWASTGVSSSEWIAYQHPSPVDIVFVGVKVSTSYPVSGLALQYSDDGVSWSDASPLYLLAGQPALTSGNYTVLGMNTSRRPLVVVNGQLKELPAGDTLPPQAPAAHVHTTSDVAGLDAALAGKEPTISAGTTAQYWRGNKTWRDFFTDVRATVLTGLSTATNAVITAADTALSALGKLQAQITGHKDAASNAHLAKAIQAEAVDPPTSYSMPAGTVQALLAVNWADVGGLLSWQGFHTSGAGIQHPASTISNTPYGGIAATNVQAAINELDAEKASAASVREKLTAARTYYVRTDGNDSNSGLANTAGGAFLTIQKAVDVCAALDFNGFSATVQVGDGTWTAPATVSSTVNGVLTIAGNATTPDNVLWSLSSGSCLTASGPGVRVTVKDMKLQTGGVSGVVSSGRAYVTATNCTFGACGYAHITGITGGAIVISTSCRIVGSAPSFANLDNANINMTLCAFTLTGTPAFSNAFIAAHALSYARCVLPTFSGAATGARYNINTNSVINVNAAGETFLPGNAAGTKTTGGEYQ